VWDLIGIRLVELGLCFYLSVRERGKGPGGRQSPLGSVDPVTKLCNSTGNGSGGDKNLCMSAR
jgi:hypothetical protein